MITLRLILVISLVYCCVCEEESEAESRGLRDDFINEWRGIENKYMDRAHWTPDISSTEKSSTEIQMPKRRRLRKRKRRPQIPLFDGESELINERLPHRRRRPTRLDENRESWKEMEEESRTRPNKRRRIIPKYQDVQVFTEDNLSALQFGHKDKTLEDDIGVLQADQGIKTKETIHPTTITPDLKTLLKQKGGLSLSEILQQKNLSLADLLNGEKEAISALTDDKPNAAITEYKNPVEIPRKIKYSSNYRLDNTIKNTANDLHHESNENLIENVNFGEETTERIFVPSNSKYYTTIDYKPNIIIDLSAKSSNDSIILNTKNDKHVSSTTTTTPKSQSLISNVKHLLPITSAKLNKKINSSTHKNESAVTSIPPQGIKININEIFGFPNYKENETDKKEEGPLRMSFNLNELIDKTTVKLQTEFKHKSTENYIEFTTKIPIEPTISIITTTPKSIPVKLKAITAKDEIMEILKDTIAKENLSKILALRNMTIEQLVELRERGSSQRHLADIFHNKTKEPEPKSEPHIGHIKSQVISFKPFTYFDRKPKSSPLLLEIQNETNIFHAPFDEIRIEESNERKTEIKESEDRDKYTVTSFPTFKIAMDKKFKENKSFAASFGKIIRPSIYSSMQSDILADTYHKATIESVTNDSDDIQTVDLIENTISEATDDKLNVDVNSDVSVDTSDEEEIFLKLPYGVKSAIFASLSIVGISLVLFLTILMIFKWSQKHKEKLCYTNSFSCSRSKTPILKNSQKKIFATIMNETLGRKKHYYKQHLQSMSDSIWDNDKKPFQ